MKRLLLLKTGAFGDMILVSVSINAVFSIFPGCEIYLLTTSKYAGIYQDCPLIKKIFSLPSKIDIPGFLKLIRKLRQKKFDIIFDLQGNLKTNFFSFLFGVNERIGFYKKSAGKLFLTCGIKKKSGTNPIDAQILFWEKIAKKSIHGKLQVWIPEEKKKKLYRYLHQNGLETKRYIVFHTSASAKWKTKLWIIENWIALGNSLARKGFHIVLIGDANSKGTHEKIGQSINGKVVNLSGDTDFFQLSLLIENAAMLITSDSGPMHIGAAVGTKTVGIFGPTDPLLHCPPSVVAIKAEVDCAPCYKKRCAHISCMKAISPDVIMDRVEMMIEKELNVSFSNEKHSWHSAGRWKKFQVRAPKA
ncbi:MAG: glycosyltransferase family 9 protein [Candidatus Omnitrophica bacterium]|nr:glycosyltransferase family 9 protein [Candidatus Omnitrophota bacterium]